MKLYIEDFVKGRFEVNKMYRTGRPYKAKGFFGTWLVENLIASKCVYADLVNAIGVNYTTIFRYVSMRTHPTYYVTKQICIFFHEPNVEAVYQKVLDDIESKREVPEYRRYNANRFNGWLINELAERNLTKDQFAAEIGISKYAVSDHIVEKKYPNRDIVERYAKYFGVDVKDIYDRISYSKQYHKKKGEANAPLDV